MTVPHGTSSRYTNQRCRCPACRAANAVWQLEARQRRKAAMDRGEVSPPHGTESTYLNYACRCSDCRAAHMAQKRRRLAMAS